MVLTPHANDHIEMGVFRGSIRLGALLLLFLSLTAPAVAQESPGAPLPDKKDQPQVRINYLNVCTPSDDEQKEIRNALSSIPATKFTADFEISRGRSSLEQAPPANWVRVRREFAPGVPYVAAQYAITVDEKAIIETLVFRSR